MSRLAIQGLFVSASLAWSAYVAIDLFGYTFGDCADDACERYREAMRSVIVWRGLFVALLIVIGYRFFRKESDV